MTAQATDAFKAYRQSNGTLRGAMFEASRPSKQANGRLVIRLRSTDLSGIALPDPPDVEAILSILWNISINEIKSGEPTKGLPRILVDTPDDISPIGGNHQGLNDRHAS